MKRSRKMIAAGIALTLALGGGAAYAASESSSSPAPSAADQQTNKAGKAEMKGKFAAGKSGKIAIHPKQQLSAAATALGMEEEAVRTELKAGKSLADLAKEKGVAVDTVIAALTKDAEEKIDKQVEAGKLTAEQAATAKQKAAEQAKQAVEQTGFADFGGGRGHGFGPGGPGGKHGGGGLGINAPLDKIAEIVGLSVEDLQKELEADKSIADIALEKGISKDQLIAKLQELTKPALEKFVDHKGGFKGKVMKKKDAAVEQPTASE